MGWSTMIKDEKIDSDIIVEIEKDIERLNKITKRFSEIGSVPKLYKENVNEILNNFIKYLNKRNSSLIKLKFNSCNEVIYFRINKTLFEWVIENLIKNAIDSMNGKGTIEINVIKTNNLNPNYSSFFFCIILFYLFFEVFFSFFRKISQKKSPIHPDSEHLHMLTFTKISKIFGKEKGNYINSIVINLVNIIFILPAIIFAKDPLISRYWFFSLIAIYLLIYLRLYRLTKN